MWPCDTTGFCQQLSSIPETANSEDMQEFLALSSDACTYFGRRPVVKSKIDKVRINLHTVDIVKRVRKNYFFF